MWIFLRYKILLIKFLYGIFITVKITFYSFKRIFYLKYNFLKIWEGTMKKNKIMPIVLSFVVGSQPFTALAAELSNMDTIDTQNRKFVLDMNL